MKVQNLLPGKCYKIGNLPPGFPEGTPKTKGMQKIIGFFSCIGLLLLSGQTFSQVTDVQFGKNRVQYHRDFDEWAQYESDNFITYWYGEARNIGQASLQLAEYDFAEIQRLLEHRINEKIQIIVYTDLTDLKQSNIGSEEAFTNTGGLTKIVGNKIFVYFDGNHLNLRKQVREGIANVYLDAMLFGSNIQEIVQNAVLLNLPDWFKEGLISYVGETWSTELDGELRDAMLSTSYEGFETLAKVKPRLAGHALWYYIAEKYGKRTVSNLLYLTRINRNTENGFLYVLGSSFPAIIKDWTAYFENRYRTETQYLDQPALRQIPIKNKRKLPLNHFQLSPDGTRAVYVTNEIGQFKVYLQDLLTNERKVIFKGGFRNAFQATDYNYPMLDWSPNNSEIAILFEKRDQPRLVIYDASTGDSKTEDLASRYQRIYSMDFANPNMLVFSAASGGQSDIFLYYINNRQSQRITSDFYDDLHAAYVRVNNRSGIIFSSNRPEPIISSISLDTILPIETFDLFYYDLENRGSELVRITHTPLANERTPTAIDTTYFSFLSDESGIYNRYYGYLEDYVHHNDQVIYFNDGTSIRLNADSVLTELDTAIVDSIVIEPVIKKRAVNHPASNYTTHIAEQSMAPRVNKFVELLRIEDGYTAFMGTIATDTTIVPFSSTYAQLKRNGLGLGANFVPDVPKKTEEVPLDFSFQVPEQSVRIREASPVTTPPVDPVPAPPVEAPKDSNAVDIDNYLFQTEFLDAAEKARILEQKQQQPQQQPQVVTGAPTATAAKPSTSPSQGTSPASPARPVYKFRPGAITPYRLTFRTDFVTTQMDNSLLFEGLQSYVGNQQEFAYPPPGILLKANFKDLFEDYEFEGGVRIPTSFNGSEYFLIFNNKKNRLDKTFAVYRKNERITEPSNSFVPQKKENNIVLGQFGVRYPLDIFRSLRGTATLRRDRSTQLATELGSLRAPTISEQRAGIKLEYVFDNTLDIALNLKNGTRYKIYAEAVKRFDLDLDEGSISLDLNDGFMGILGVDARHYQRLLKHSVLAARFAAATSFGSEQILYYMGGVNNWLFPTQDNDVAVPPGINFAYQALATNMRGFNINIRNGNSYVLSNLELRVPVFRYLSTNMRSPFFRNFQLTGFFDVGTAWGGKDPFSIDNPLNTTVIPNSDAISVRVNFFRDPLVAGYGLGVRSMLFGYFVRVDYAWGLETRRVLDPKLYISLGMDF